MHYFLVAAELDENQSVGLAKMELTVGFRLQ